MENSQEFSVSWLLKVRGIFNEFDRNQDGGLNRSEVANLTIAVNPRVKFSEAQIEAVIDEVFRIYGGFIDGDRGLSFKGLLQSYADGAGDVDRDFDVLGLQLQLPVKIVAEFFKELLPRPVPDADGRQANTTLSTLKLFLADSESVLDCMTELGK